MLPTEWKMCILCLRVNLNPMTWVILYICLEIPSMTCIKLFSFSFLNRILLLGPRETILLLEEERVGEGWCEFDRDVEKALMKRTTKSQ